MIQSNPPLCIFPATYHPQKEFIVNKIANLSSLISRSVFITWKKTQTLYKIYDFDSGSDANHRT